MPAADRGVAGWNGSSYDRVSWPQLAWGMDTLARLGELGCSTVLDAGCGSGRVTEALLTVYPDISVIALDGSAGMLMQARRRLADFGHRVTFVQADLSRDLSGPLDGFPTPDAVLSTGTFHWLHDHSGLYARLYRTLAPGGSLVAQCGGADSVQEIRDILDALGIAWRPFNTYATAAETARWLAAAGFVDVWTWLTAESVTFADRDAVLYYRRAGALAPYLAGHGAAEQQLLGEEIAARMREPTLHFRRLNLLARRPAQG
jgi:trans-aconitate 2-methyltransferase